MHSAIFCLAVLFFWVFMCAVSRVYTRYFTYANKKTEKKKRKQNEQADMQGIVQERQRSERTDSMDTEWTRSWRTLARLEELPTGGRVCVPDTVSRQKSK